MDFPPLLLPMHIVCFVNRTWEPVNLTFTQICCCCYLTSCLYTYLCRSAIKLDFWTCMMALCYFSLNLKIIWILDIKISDTCWLIRSWLWVRVVNMGIVDALRGSCNEGDEHMRAWFFNYFSEDLMRPALIDVGILDLLLIEQNACY
jgi:hypothetical protein